MKVFKRKDGKEVTLLSPKEKGNKYAKELKEGYATTNAGEVKMSKDGSTIINLSDSQRAYRAGYLDARKDIGKAREHVLKKQNKSK